MFVLLFDRFSESRQYIVNALRTRYDGGAICIHPYTTLHKLGKLVCSSVVRDTGVLYRRAKCIVSILRQMVVYSRTVKRSLVHYLLLAGAYYYRVYDSPGDLLSSKLPET